MENVLKVSEPVVVVIKAKGCGHCTRLEGLWPEVEKALRQVYPRLRFYFVNMSRMDAPLASEHPRGLMKYMRGFPTILLVPGRLWDVAMNNLHAITPVELRTGVQIMNGEIGDQVRMDQTTYKYDTTQPSRFGDWLLAAMNEETFRRAQYDTGVKVTTQPLSSTPTTSIMSNRNSTQTPIIKEGENICQLRFVSRQR